jgi:hypothetical protein
MSRQASSTPELGSSQELEALWRLEGSVRTISAPDVATEHLATRGPLKGVQADGYCLHQLFEARADASGDVPCLVTADDVVRLSFSEVRCWRLQPASAHPLLLCFRTTSRCSLAACTHWQLQL